MTANAHKTNLKDNPLRTNKPLPNQSTASLKPAKKQRDKIINELAKERWGSKLVSVSLPSGIKVWMPNWKLEALKRESVEFKPSRSLKKRFPSEKVKKSGGFRVLFNRLVYGLRGV